MSGGPGRRGGPPGSPADRGRGRHRAAPRPPAAPEGTYPPADPYPSDGGDPHYRGDSATPARGMEAGPYGGPAGTPPPAGLYRPDPYPPPYAMPDPRPPVPHPPGHPAGSYPADPYPGYPSGPFPAEPPPGFDPYRSQPPIPQPSGWGAHDRGARSGARDRESNGALHDTGEPPDTRFNGWLPAGPYRAAAPHEPQDPYAGMRAGAPEISGPMPVAPWPDYPAISGPIPVAADAGPYPGGPYPGGPYPGGPYPGGPYPGGPYPGGQGMPGGYDDAGDPGDGYDDAGDPGDGYDDAGDPGDGYDWEPGDGASEPVVPMGSGGRRNRPGDRQARRRGRRFSAPLIAVLVIALLLAGGGVAGYRFLRQYVIPPDYSGPGSGSVTVQIKQNQTATDVAQTLFGLGVVASTRAFVKAAEQSSRPTALEPGFYRMHRHMKAALAFDLLLNPAARIQLDVTIPEGLRASQIVTTLGTKTGISLADYRAALADPAALGLPAYAKDMPEGYLFPATYPVQPRVTATDVLRAMVRQFDAEAARINLVATAQSVNLTPAEAIIVASLVQAEGGRIADFPKIARVIYNRLAGNMPLQLDSTVMYALHRYGILATNQQLQVNSPYNTYLHPGLPPGPIDSPGDAAIRAALHPAKGPWLYFVTVNPKTGVTEFTSSYAAFLQLRAELERNLGGSG
jgi:peptidoglycan lytic transglycosylase G